MKAILVGNPNTGKTTLFNTLTSSNEHTGNWHGVTVEEKKKDYVFEGKQIQLVDLPGVYSLCPFSFEEQVSCEYLFANTDSVVLCTCDQNNLRKNLYLALCLIESGMQVIVVINQIGKKKKSLDFAHLSKLLGVEVLVVDGKNKEDCEKINKTIISGQNKGNKRFAYLEEIDTSPVKEWEGKAEKWQLVALVEDNPIIKKQMGISQNFDNAEMVAKARYEFLDKLLSQCGYVEKAIQGKSKLDQIFLNKFLAIPMFFAVLAIVFFLTFFSVGRWVALLFENILSVLVFDPISAFLAGLFGGQSWICGLFDNAICGGVGMVASFLPQVGLLMLFLTVLEESGYLSRVAFLFDDLLSKVGLSGKAVYTLLMGFGCSTTAVLSARTMDEGNAKIKTALLCPYMSCSAKFPIYAVVGGAMFGADNVWVIMGLYLLGVVVALALSLVLEKTALKSRGQSFILEFPNYHVMGIKKLLLSLWQSCKSFLSKVGGIIVVMNVVLWALSNFSLTFEFVGQGNGVSILQTLGQLFSPIFIPLGFGGWALASSLIAGVFAKEVIVSSIALFNGVEGAGVGKLQASILSLSALCSLPSKASVLSFLCFALLYMPCISTMLVMKKEIGIRWTIFACVMQFAIAYIVSFVVYNLTLCCEIFGFLRVIFFILAMATVVLSFVYAGRKMYKKRCPYSEKCGHNCKKK